MTLLSHQAREAMARCQVPGVAAGLICNGDEEHLGYGVANIETGLPLDSDTIIQCGPITKAVTATLTMRLVDAGALDLDTPIRAYLPTFRLADDRAIDIGGGGTDLTVTDFLRACSGDIRWLRVRGRAFVRQNGLPRQKNRARLVQ